MSRLTYIALFVVLATCSMSRAQNCPDKDVPGKVCMYFAVGLFTNGHSQLITYAFISVMDNHIVGTQIVDEKRFIYTALGYWPDKINPKREDFFATYQVDSCLLVKEGTKVVGYYAKPFEDLWKLRFYEHPFQYDIEGWSQGQYKPSLGQREFLKREYGVENILTEYIYGDSLFKLLRDVQNSAWISTYKTATLDTLASP